MTILRPRQYTTVPLHMIIASTMMLANCDGNHTAGSNMLALATSPASTAATIASGTAQWSIPANTSTLVSVQTLPFAVCLLHSAIAAEAAATTKVYADDVGTVRVYMEPSSLGINLVSTFVLDCTDDTGLLKSFPLRIRVVPDSMPAASNQSVDPAVVHGTIRPALAGDPTIPSAQELLAGNYPPRPNRELAPGAYSDWLKLVSVQTTIVSSRLTAKDDESFSTNPGSPTSSHTWGGTYLDQLLETTRAVTVWGALTVPSIPPATSCPATTCEAAFWLGMDGRQGASDVAQAGIDFKQTHVGWFWLSTFNTFIEWAPDGAFFVPSLVPQSGDQIALQVWITDSAGNYLPPPIAANTPGVKANLYISDLRSNTTYTGSLPMPAGITFQGLYAEWIVERPLNANGQHWPLAKFNPAVFFNPGAQEFSGTTCSFSGSDPGCETMDINLTDSSSSGQILASGTHLLNNGYNYAISTWFASGTIF